MSPEELEELLNQIVQNGLRMSNIIDLLLLLAGIRRKKTVQIQPSKMAEILAEVQQRLTPMIEEYKAQLILPASWPVAHGYPPWVEEIWANYLTNAIKYGGYSPILTLNAQPIPNGNIRFWVQDNGNGINPNAQAQLFTPFTKLVEANK